MYKTLRDIALVLVALSPAFAAAPRPASRDALVQPGVLIVDRSLSLSRLTQSLARSLYAIEQPADVEIGEVVVRPSV